MYNTKTRVKAHRAKEAPPGIYFSGVSVGSIKILEKEALRLGYPSKAKYLDALLKWVGKIK
jgi:hypothetical protein